MGLDNGIVLSRVSRDLIPAKVHLFFDEPEHDRYELAYWRKCWGVRGEIMEAINYVDNSLGGSMELSIRDIENLIFVMKKFLKKDYWDENANSIWTFQQYRRHQKHIVKNLKWLVGFKRKHPEARVEFYDSF